MPAGQQVVREVGKMHLQAVVLALSGASGFVCRSPYGSRSGGGCEGLASSIHFEGHAKFIQGFSDIIQLTVALTRKVSNPALGASLDQSVEVCIQSLVDHCWYLLRMFLSSRYRSLAPLFAPVDKIMYLCTSRTPFLFLFSMFLFSKLLLAIWFPKSLPCDVLEESKGTIVVVDCSERHLTAVPWGIPSNVTNLTLTINHIPRITPQTFSQFKDLVEIDFRCNCVPAIMGPKDHVCTKRLVVEDRSFESLHNLRSLYLDGNQLLEFPRRLPPSLVLLSLEANNIFSISRVNLSEFTNIEMLYLGQNCYYRNPCNVSFYIEKEAFKDLHNLTVLSLKSNNLSFVPVGLSTSLKELYLYNNIIQSVKKDDLTNLYNLEILDLSGNCPRCYNSPFPCNPCPNNAPIQIDDNAFASLKNLKTLRLHSNSLHTVSKSWFQNITNLQVLDLSQNFLASEISTASFLKLVPKLKSLDFSFNFELQVYPTELNLSSYFSTLKSLEILRIRGYVFQNLRRTNLLPLVHLSNLTVLDLGTNFIKMADFSIFKYFHSLKIIGLANNKISPSGESNLASCSAFRASPEHYKERSFQDIHYFQYDENARRCKSKVKEDLSFELFVNEDCQAYGQTLDLSQNNIFFVKSSDFTHLSFLKCLNLSGNAISQTLNGTEFTPLNNLKYLDFSNNRIDLLYSTAFQELTKLEVLDLSSNKHYFLAEGITHMINFTKNLKYLKKLMLNWNEISSSTNDHMVSQSLHTLEFKGNHLNILWRDGYNRYLNLFKNLNELSRLDISSNSLQFLPPGAFEGMPPKLMELCLAKNNLNTFNWGKLYLLEKLQVLDLSDNYLTTVPRELSNCTTSIKTLILHNNKIDRLTTNFLRDAFTLKHLDLSDNKIKFIGKSSFPENVINNLEILILQGNPFKCNCDAVWLVSWINHTTVTIPNLVTDVICAGPGTHRGQSLILLDLYTCEQDNVNVILHSVSASFIICLMVICTSSHLFYWDFWYIYHLFKAKIKGYKRLPKVCYDALIMYDTKDCAVSDWVLNELVNNLEKQGEKMFNCCLEERDFLAGQPFLDNLYESIQMSRKTVFVVTEKYIKCGHFKTAFYIAHQRLIEEKVDVIILILLEKTLQRSRYLRLRKRICANSVLYWPSNPNSHKYFWHCLKNALTTDNEMAYDKVFKERR
ncbi:toll-like receptor 7 [Rhinophrynus dorsalis]